jgi:ectoine hydroxylase-related dioxygenase (phytanoyl-CoA dioxygenase family)
VAAVTKPLELNRAAINTADARRAGEHANRTAFRAELTQRIVELDLMANVGELDVQGYTVVRNAASMDHFRELRARILELSQARRAGGNRGDRRGVFSDTIVNCLFKGRIFEQTVLNPKLNALMAYLLGDGYVVNATQGIVVEQGAAALPIHTDNAYVPDPFPAWALSATSIWITEDLTAESGATRIIPGSHHYRRHVDPGEGEDEAIPIEVPAGSVIVWNGATWHGNCGRQAAGERVTFHTSFCRMFMRPFADNENCPQDVIDRNPPLLAQMLGLKLPQGHEGEGGPNPERREYAGRLAARRL